MFLRQERRWVCSKACGAIIRIWIVCSQPLTLGRGSEIKLEAEEALVVALLAIGMSALVALTILIFW